MVYDELSENEIAGMIANLRGDSAVYKVMVKGTRQVVRRVDTELEAQALCSKLGINTFYEKDADGAIAVIKKARIVDGIIGNMVEDKGWGGEDLVLITVEKIEGSPTKFLQDKYLKGNKDDE